MQKRLRPLAEVRYPRTFQEFEEWFATEARCRKYLARVRWPTGFQCPQRHSRDEPWITVRGCLRCKGCRCDLSIIGGTLFEGTRKLLRDWYWAIWFVMSQKHGASALGLGSYQTVWSWLHKMRRAMVLPGPDHLSGTVEVDETFIGAPEEDGHGREPETRAIVIVAAENRGKAIGRIRLQRLEDASAARLTSFIQKSIGEGSLLITAGWSGYSSLENLGYGYAIRTIQRSGLPANAMLPRVHRVASHLKRWLLGTLQGGVQHRHFDYYPCLWALP